MQRSTVLFLLVGCTAAAVAAIMAFSGPGGEVLPPGGPGADPARHEGAGQENGSDGAAGIASPEAAAQQSAAYQGPVPSDAPHVRITVTAKEKFVPPPARLPLAELANGTPLLADVIAGAGAGFDAQSNRRGVAMLAVDYESGQLLRQISRVPGQTQPTTIGARVVLRGRILDGAQQPIGGASVWLGERLADGSRREFATDDEGAFEGDVPGGAGVPMVVRADGYASTWRTLTIGTATTPITERLLPAGKLSVQLAARADGLEAVRVFVTPKAPVSTGLSQWPFFLQCLSGGYAVDERGQATIDDLPQHGTVGVVVSHPFAESGAAVVAKLAEAPARATVPITFSGGRQMGVVVGPDGLGIAASLWLRAPNQRLQGSVSSRLLPPHIDLRGVCSAQAASDGRFEIGLLEDANPVLSVRAPGFAGRDLDPQRFRNAEIVLPQWLPGDAALRIQPPVAGKVWRVSINLGEGLEENCKADQPFVVALPHAGIFDLEMVVDVGGKPVNQRLAKDLMITGPTDVETPSPN